MFSLTENVVDARCLMLQSHNLNWIHTTPQWGVECHPHFTGSETEFRECKKTIQEHIVSDHTKICTQVHGTVALGPGNWTRGKCNLFHCTPGDWGCIFTGVLWATSASSCLGEELHTIMTTAFTSTCLIDAGEHGFALISLVYELQRWLK